MKKDNKCERRKIYKTEEVKTFEASQRNKYSMQENIKNLGYTDDDLDLSKHTGI